MIGVKRAKRGCTEQRVAAVVWARAVKMGEFQRRYFAKMDQKPEAWRPLLKAAQEGGITLLFSARDTEHNNAFALKS